MGKLITMWRAFWSLVHSEEIRQRDVEIERLKANNDVKDSHIEFLSNLLESELKWVDSVTAKHGLEVGKAKQ